MSLVNHNFCSLIGQSVLIAKHSRQARSLWRNFLLHKKESCSQDSPPAAGRSSDTIPIRRSAIPAEHLYRIGMKFPIR